MRVAIIDLGTNTCRLFLAEVEKAGDESAAPRVRVVEREATVVRLGKGVDEEKRLAPDAVERTLACLRTYAQRLPAFAPQRTLLIATSALRDAADGAEFLARVRAEIGLPSRVLSGVEEAGLSFAGGTVGLVGQVDDPLVLIDIGGGSTEFACGLPGSPPETVFSCDIGAVRLTERFIAHDPPLAEERAAVEEYAVEVINAALPDRWRRSVKLGIGVAGTFTTIVAAKLGFSVYDPQLVHGYLLTRADLEEAAQRFASLTSAERGRLPGLQAGREDVIVAGTLIAIAACRCFGLAAIRCSESDLLEGAARALAAGTLESLAP